MGVPDTPPAGRRPMAKPWPTPVLEAAQKRASQVSHRRSADLRELQNPPPGTHPNPGAAARIWPGCHTTVCYVRLHCAAVAR